MDAPLAKPRVSLRLKLSVGLILIISVLFASINVYTVLSHRDTRIRDAERQLTSLARLLSASLATDLSESSERIKRVVIRQTMQTGAQLMKFDPALAFIMVTTPEYEVIDGVARPELIAFPNEGTLREEASALARIAELRGRLGGVMKTKRFEIKNASREVEALAWVGISLADAEAQARTELIANAVALVAALLLMVVYASVVLARVVVQPLRRVIDSMRAVRDGDLSHDLDLGGNDEIGVLASNFNFMLEGLRERENLKDAFNRYVSRQVYEKLQEGELTLSGEYRNATILFSDIRSFTALSEQMTAADVVELLNEYFTEMVEIIFKYDGFLNKFIGDAIMAVFNAPLNQTQPELRAVRTAVEMQLALHRLNTKRAHRGQHPIRAGIGINTGAVVAGNIGHEQRLEYTVIGDAVNLAQRIESQTKVSGASILISETTYEAVAAHVEAEALPPVKVKGKQAPVKLFAVTALKPVEQARHRPPETAAT